MRAKIGSISDTRPKAGRIIRYTSGCPKTQNRFSHNSGLPPLCTLKKLAWNSRSNISRNWAVVSTGMANSSRNCVTRVIQVNTGMRNMVMPGQRMFSTVTIRLTAPVSEATPVMIRPRFQ